MDPTYLGPRLLDAVTGYFLQSRTSKRSVITAHNLPISRFFFQYEEFFFVLLT